MPTQRSLPIGARFYVWTVVVFGMTAITASVYQLYTEPIGYQWFVLAALTLISGSATVKLPSVPATISISETFVFTSVLLFGTAAGTLTVALDGLIISFWLAARRKEIHRVFFNMAAPALSIWLAAHVFFWSADIKPLVHQPSDIRDLLLPLVLFTVTYFSLNSWLIAFAVGYETTLSRFRIWRDNFLWLSLNYFGGASVALLLVAYTRKVDLTFLGTIVPLLLILYFTFKTSMGRVEDANRHLSQLNRLYLSTIETLAMAIDAKDQITHGHIRRVQSYAVGLAKALGVKDELLLKAIEAAALLHDMGKLAVPEYILNKPGRLTAPEFEKMKLHASVGADILSAIDFPYPVVPIVRHHHENWDGTGYPAGLSGTNIPIGGRILSVVDCFDALTSDRPYRPRLSDEEALRILMQRRGTMYDPLVVDTFVKVYVEITPRDLEHGTHKHALAEITRSSYQADTGAPSNLGLDDITASTEEMLTLYDLARALAGKTSLADAGDVISKHLRRIVPASLCAFYVYEPSSNELVAAHAAGEGETLVRGLRIPLGERLTGWVGANRLTILNSDPTLDLGDAARTMKPRFRSCLSTPLISGDSLIGVLTLYATAPDIFSEDHRRIIEAVVQQISHTVEHATEFERVRLTSLKDSVTGLPNVEHLKQFLTSEAANRLSSPLTLMFLTVERIDDIVGKYGREAGDFAISHVVSSARRALRAADIMFRYGNAELVVLLTQTDSSTANTIGSRICNYVETSPPIIHEGRSLDLRVSVGFGTLPGDGGSLTDLVQVARQRVAPRLQDSPKINFPPSRIH